MAEDIIHLLNKCLKLTQPPGGFRSSMDTVFVAAACPATSGESVLDLGCGVGAAGLCVKARVPGIFLTGIDIQQDQVFLARENATLNSLKDCTFMHADIREFGRAKDGKNIVFDHVICNPPYNDDGAHIKSPSKAKALAMGHSETTLQDWIDAAIRNLKSGGTLTLIHKAEQIDKIILAMNGHFGALEILPLWPRENEAAKRIILRAQKDRKTPTTLGHGIVLHDASGEYSARAEEILRHMKSL